MTNNDKVRQPIKWNGDALARLITDVIATAKVRQGMSTSRRTTVEVDAELFERLQMVGSQVAAENARKRIWEDSAEGTTVRPADPVTHGSEAMDILRTHGVAAYRESLRR
ncbi:hypothetical protein [Pseudonocardia sp. 73-21]|uniref:hypothetical protein n=1 Tax=Pseudonocardia sp. 73-21 TaxID=1895809 RepID=UPI0009653BB1|nr:hypothetical protein [Pseudonocardia sp. 73-21]OJY40316.1 MAG: hypothetical protein BGP03_00425 [Pseudonocardia sp. 73-21]